MPICAVISLRRYGEARENGCWRPFRKNLNLWLMFFP